MQETLTLPKINEATILPRRFIHEKERQVPVSATRVAVRRILLPFDLSRSSVCALRVVTQFAEKNGASIHLLHVVRPSDDQGSETKRADDHLAEESERLLKHWVKRVVQGRVQTYVSIRIGEPVDVILARATAVRADLIVMTSRSCSGLKNELQRSSAERISRLAPCAVLTIPEKCAEKIAYNLEGFLAGKMNTVLMPVDFSSTSEHALSVAASLADEHGAKLLIAHGSEDDHLSVHMRLRTWAEQTLGDSFAFETAAWPGGHSLFAILAQALRSVADLIVLPTHAQSWARRLRGGSISDGVIRQAPCPVLSINENAVLN